LYSEDGVNFKEVSYKADLTWDKECAYNGERSLSIKNLGGGHGVSWESSEIVLPSINIPYTLSVWVREETEWFSDYWEYPREDRKKIGIDNDIIVWINIVPCDSERNYISSLFASVEPSSEWSLIEVSGYLPPGTEKVKLELSAQEQTGYLHENSVWFDDIYFGPAGS